MADRYMYFILIILQDLQRGITQFLGRAWDTKQFSFALMMILIPSFKCRSKYFNSLWYFTCPTSFLGRIVIVIVILYKFFFPCRQRQKAPSFVASDKWHVAYYGTQLEVLRKILDTGDIHACSKCFKEMITYIGNKS